SLTRITQRLETWAVIDGKIILFHINSHPDNEGSYIVLGDHKHPLLDPLFSQPRALLLPPIESLDDLSYLAMPASGSPRYQDLLFSVKTPSPFMGADGITFVVSISS